MTYAYAANAEAVYALIPALKKAKHGSLPYLYRTSGSEGDVWWCTNGIFAAVVRGYEEPAAEFSQTAYPAEALLKFPAKAMLGVNEKNELLIMHDTSTVVVPPVADARIPKLIHAIPARRKNPVHVDVHWMTVLQEVADRLAGNRTKPMLYVLGSDENHAAVVQAAGIDRFFGLIMPVKLIPSSDIPSWVSNTFKGG